MEAYGEAPAAASDGASPPGEAGPTVARRGARAKPVTLAPGSGADRHRGGNRTARPWPAGAATGAGDHGYSAFVDVDALVRACDGTVADLTG